MSRNEKMQNVLKLQSFDFEEDYSKRASIAGQVSPASIAACMTPLPSSVTSVAVCNN